MSILVRHYTDYSPELLKRIYYKAGLKVLYKFLISLIKFNIHNDILLENAFYKVKMVTEDWQSGFAVKGLLARLKISIVANIVSWKTVNKYKSKLI